MATHHAYLRLMIELADDGEGFDLVHSHSLHYLPVSLAPLLPVPVLLTLHTPPTPWLESALRARRGAAPALAAVSRATAALVAPGVADVPHVVANGVDTARGRSGREASTRSGAAGWCARRRRTSRSTPRGPPACRCA